MPRGLKLGKILEGARPNRDWQNIPLDKVYQTAKRMPYPVGLVPNEEKALTTVYLNKSTIRFFKKEADKHHTKYQRLIRAVLDLYADTHRS